MIDVAQAFELLDSSIAPLSTETVSVDAALGRVAATELRAKISLPPFSQSAMDGYALRSEDLAGAAQQAPVRLTQVGEVAAGDAGDLPKVRPGQVVRVFTGGRLPPGADAVVRQEEIERRGAACYFRRPVPPGADIRPTGEELEEGARLVSPGERLGAGAVGVLSMCGHAEVEVYRAPVITLLISGDEIAAPGRPLRPGAVYDANRPFLASWLRMRGYRDVRGAALPDSREAVVQELGRAFDRSDLVISTGGVSVGDYDFFGEAAQAIGLETVFWRVNQRPGKPLLFAKRAQKVMLGVPGNPGAVFVSAYVYLKRVLDLMEGAAVPGARMRSGVLGGAVGRCSWRETWCGCTVDERGDGQSHLTPVGGSAMTQLYKADAIARIPTGAGEMSKGSMVQWFSLNE